MRSQGGPSSHLPALCPAAFDFSSLLSPGTCRSGSLATQSRSQAEVRLVLPVNMASGSFPR